MRRIRGYKASSGEGGKEIGGGMEERRREGEGSTQLSTIDYYYYFRGLKQSLPND